MSKGVGFFFLAIFFFFFFLVFYVSFSFFFWVMETFCSKEMDCVCICVYYWSL